MRWSKADKQKYQKLYDHMRVLFRMGQWGVPSDVRWDNILREYANISLEAEQDIHAAVTTALYGEDYDKLRVWAFAIYYSPGVTTYSRIGAWQVDRRKAYESAGPEETLDLLFQIHKHVEARHGANKQVKTHLLSAP